MQAVRGVRVRELDGLMERSEKCLSVREREIQGSGEAELLFKVLF